MPSNLLTSYRHVVYGCVVSFHDIINFHVYLYTCNLHVSSELQYRIEKHDLNFLPFFFYPSFLSLSRSSNGTNVPITKQGTYMLDSGGQYL